MIRIFIDGIEYSEYLENGLSLQENLDEELDVAVVVLSKTDIFDTFTPFNRVEIIKNGQIIKRLLVSNDDVTLASKNPELYTHELTLVENTKMLERYFIDGKTFTQPIEEKSGYPPYTLLDVVMYLRASVPLRHESELVNTGTTEKPYFETLNNHLFNIPEDTKNELDAITAPEFTFKEATLREALDEVASYIDCNVFLDDYFNLRLNKFNQLNEQISNDDFIDRTINRDIEYYATNMETNVMNVVGKLDRGDINVEHYPSKNIFSNSKTNDLLWDYPNSFLVTNNPIYDVKRVTFKLNGSWAYVVDNSEVESIPEQPLNFVVNDVFERQYASTLPTVANKTQAYQAAEPRANTSLVYDYGKKNVNLPILSRSTFNLTVRFNGIYSTVEDIKLLFISALMFKSNLTSTWVCEASSIM